MMIITVHLLQTPVAQYTQHVQQAVLPTELIHWLNTTYSLWPCNRLDSRFARAIHKPSCDCLSMPSY